MSARKPVDNKTKRETTKDDNLIKKAEEKLKKNVYTVSTPRNFVQKSSAADIYSRKSNSIQNARTSRKSPAPSNSRNNVISIKDSLKSSPSAISQISTRSHGSKTSVNELKTVGVKKLPLANVTVNSPIVDKRKLNLDKLKRMKDKDKSKEAVKRSEETPPKPALLERKRTKTRTLDEGEIKILTSDVIDLEMLNRAKKLSAQPKAFYIDLDEDKSKLQQKPTECPSDEELSYEDDFESYESDFDSYRSETQSEQSEKPEDFNNDTNNEINESKEERMLDSGNFELRDARPVSKSQPMDFIVEGTEEVDKKPSLTDEGFQEMSTSSGLSSMKTLHIDILEKPLFVDFTKSRENRRKRKLFDRLRQRANDILNMVTLHEMSYDLFVMKSIPYDLYMATFGRFNSTQAAVQTFDDGVTEEIQTDDVVLNDKWTQHPIEFSKNNFNTTAVQKRNDGTEKFAFLDSDYRDSKRHEHTDDNYTSNPLRMFLEQKDGAGSDAMLPCEIYELKFKNSYYDVKKLGKFLKKVESKISSVLCRNSGDTMSNLIKTSKFPFSNELLLISTNGVSDNLSFLKNSQVIGAIFSETKNNLLITVHDKMSSGLTVRKCVLCLWDLSVNVLEPLKVLVATDNVKIGRFRGSTDGFLVAALFDGTIHLWDLSEEAAWCSDVATEEMSNKMVEIERNARGAGERNENNENGVYNQRSTLYACAYTSSALNVLRNDIADSIVGLELTGECSQNLDCGRKVLAQLCALQSIGILTIWSIIQDRSRIVQPDIGKALWSKLKLERNQTINLFEHVYVPTYDLESENCNFNLDSAKKRMLKKRNERNKSRISRPKSAIANGEDDKSSVANRKSLVENLCLWENYVVCNHLKVIHLKNVEHYLVAKNGGEVLCCRRNIGTVKVRTFSVASRVTSITCIETSPHKLPYFLAATDSGTVNMCSLLDYRVLLTLDCRNCPVKDIDKCQADSKGRFLSSFKLKTADAAHVTAATLPVNAVSWLHNNPFCIAATLGSGVVFWELTHSDIRPAGSSDGFCCATTDRAMTLLTKDNTLQVYKLTDSKDNCLELFEKYVSLL